MPRSRQTPRRQIKALNEWARICQPDGVLLWRQSLCGPLLLVNPSTRFVIANAPDPEGKYEKHGDVYIGHFPEQFTPSNTSIRWGQQEWATVMLPLPTDPFQRLTLLAHESFHRIQTSLGLSASDAPDPSLLIPKWDASGYAWNSTPLGRALRSTGEMGAGAQLTPCCSGHIVSGYLSAQQRWRLQWKNRKG